MNDNRPTITAFLTVSDGTSAVDFYVKAFNAKILFKHQTSDRKTMAKLAIGSGAFYLGDEEPQFGNVAPNGAPTSGVRFVLETEDADTIFENALKNGATQICPMTTEEDWRIGKLKDPFGHIWEIGYELMNRL